MRHFFIDLENVRSYGLEGVLLLKPDDMVYVFYSDNANTLTIPTIESLNESPAQVKYIKINYLGANAMDFQIVTLLGASIEREKAGSFYVISHDHGFRSAVKFCEGYFTNYDILTGVYANILTAINSERSGAKNQDENDKSGSGSKKNSRRRKGRKNNGSTDVETNNMTAASEKSFESMGTEDTAEEEMTDMPSDVSEQPEDSSEETASGRNSRNRRRRHRGRGKKNAADANAEMSADNAEEPLALQEQNAADESDESSDSDSAAETAENEEKAVKNKKSRRRGSGRRRNSKEEALENISADEGDAGLDNAGQQHADEQEKDAAADSLGVSDEGEQPDNQKSKKSSARKRRERRVRAEQLKKQEETADADEAASDSEPVKKGRGRKSSAKETFENKSYEAADYAEGKALDAEGKSEAVGKKSEGKRSAKNEPASMKYVYNALSDYLSKSTIDMYAKTIDEGIRKSKNKDELHNFFKKVYGTDEAEALYRVVASDFDDMKKHVK